MPLSMYQAAVPTISRALENLAAVLEKAAQQVDAKKFPPEAYVNARLFPDMFPLSKQVQIASDIAKGGCARLAQVEAPAFEDNETTFAQLAERARKTVKFLETLKPAQIDGSEEREIVLKMRDATRTFKGQGYLLHFVLPNFFFHASTAYDILRHNGVELGKRDFLGQVPGMNA
jgi:uncharacterized protein